MKVLLLFLSLFGASSPLDRLMTQIHQTPASTVHTVIPMDDDFREETLRLANIMENDLGATVKFAKPELENAIGSTDLETRQVFIDENLKWHARFETLAHEGGHLFHPRALFRQEGEVFAEAVMVLVCERAGDRGVLARSAQYLANAKGALHILKDYRFEIERAARILEGR